MADREALLINRERSWLEFNERVLALAEDPSTPLLERAMFLAIFGQNLDEFFGVRVAGLKDQVDAGVRTRSADGLTAEEQLALIRERVVADCRGVDRIYRDELVPALAGAGVAIVDWADLDADDRARMHELFERRLFPVLTPLAVDPGHPFPYISDLSLNLAVLVVDPTDGERRFARVKVPPLLARFVPVEEGHRFVPVEQVIAAHLGELFPGMGVEDHVVFRVTRDADLELAEDADDLLAAIELEVRRRRFGEVVRLDVAEGIRPEILDLLQRELRVDDEDTYVHGAPLDLGGLWGLHEVDRPDLKYPKFAPVTQRALLAEDGEAADLFWVVGAGDVLVHHPYDSFATSVEEFVRQASVDPAVLAIKQTLYRTSDDSDIVSSLIRAAEAGKQVVALVELKARFDEARNIERARRLERAGVHVVYGVIGLKTHVKISMVARSEGEVIRRYCHIGTGNYNANTARRYEDFGLLTADPEIGADVNQLFNYLTGFGRPVDYRVLSVAPDHMRRQLVSLIRRERSAADGRIAMKMNSLVDPEMIEELYAASADGVAVDLLVRGICCLRPQVPGLSENIRVRSIVGRYLEHSRVYRFANGDGSGTPLTLIGSADLMPRNLDRRVEALVPVRDAALAARVVEALEVGLAEDTSAWTLVDETWHPPTGGGVDAHAELQRRATDR